MSITRRWSVATTPQPLGREVAMESGVAEEFLSWFALPCLRVNRHRIRARHVNGVKVESNHDVVHCDTHAPTRASVMVHHTSERQEGVGGELPSSLVLYCCPTCGVSRWKSKHVPNRWWNAQERIVVWGSAQSEHNRQFLLSWCSNIHMFLIVGGYHTDHTQSCVIGLGRRPCRFEVEAACARHNGTVV